MENLKGYSGSKFIQIREKNIFFVLSTGRSGTQTFARSLSELPDCVCLHEPAPQLILESSDYRYGRLDCERLKQVILQTRSPVINGKVYGESNQTLSLMVPILAISFPKAKFIWLIRNGLDVVSSIFSRQWYTGHSANHSRYDDCPPLEKAWIDGRIMGDLCGDVQLAKWKSMNPFARCCWYWAYINRTIEKDLSDICSAGSYRKIKLEELDRDLPEIVEWLGFGQAPDLEPGNFNRAHYNLYPWQKWTLEERKTFLYWCGPLMDRLYPEWRSLNREFFNTLDVTLKSIKLPGENNFKNQINLQDDHYSNSKIEEFNIYFTPQLKTYPKISVFITSYNQKKYLVETIESVLTQTLNPHQIIIVDDFSNDGSQELIAKYAQKYPNLVFPIYHIKNLGVVQTRIDALNEVSGDYVTYVDGDDRFLPEKLEREFDILARNTNAQIAYSNNYYINPEGQRTGVWAEKEKPPEGSVFKETFSRCFPKSSLFRMELVNFQAWKSVGFHDPDITIYEDFDMRIRLTKHFQVAYCDKPLSEIRLHDKGLSKLKAKQHLASLEFIYHKNRSLLSDLNESDHQRVKKGFNDFVNKISLSAANQLAEDQKIKKQYSVKLSHEMLSASSKKNQPHRSSELGTNLIFLISQPRAGSTLFQRLLAGHPEIHTTAEPWVMLHPLYALKENGIKAEYRVDLALQGLNDFLMQVPEGIELYKSAIRKFGSTLYDRLLDMSGKRFFLDKTPRYYHIIPELFSVFPEANFIFLLRNPVAVLSSVLKTWFGNCVDDLQIENLVDLAKGPVCLLDGIKRLKEKAIVVEYESLVKSPEEIMHRVCTRIGIPYCGDMLEYGRNPKPQGKFGDPVGIFKYHRPVTDNIDKWQDNISSPEFVEISNQYLETLGSDIVSKMGFNFIELKQKLNSQSRFSNTVKTKLNEVRALNKKGENLFAKGEFDDALTNFQKAYNIDPNDAEINNNLGVIYCHQGDHKKASEYYKKAISLQPENVTFKKNLAEIKYVILGQAQEALQIYVNILQTHPDDIEVLLGLGKICIDLEKFDDARVFFNRVIELDPLNVEGQYGLNQLKSSKEDSCAEENNSVSFMTDKGSSVKYLVSAIVSTYNSESFIRGCLEDLEAQTISDKLEIIVVNSGSEQNEERIIKKFQKKYSNINYIRTENRETVYQAWNRGIKAASGKYITNANTDDRHRVDAFERLADELENNRDIGLIYADVFVTNFESQFFGEHIHCGYLIRPEFSLKIMLSGCHMGPQPMWRKSIHEKVGYFSSEYQSAGDYDFWCRVALHYPIKHISEFLGLYYENPDGICNSQKTLSVRETASVKNKYFSHFPSPESPQKYINNYQYGIPVSDHQYVNICMVTFNRLDFTKQAIESILKNTRYPHVISVVDNNSQDGTQEYLTKIKREGIIKNLFLLDENVGVSKASNLAWKMEPDAEYYLKLDNDIVIFKTDWLSDMIKAIDAIPQIGAIAYNFEFQSYPLTEFNGLRCRVKAEGNLGGACILIPRRIREQLGYWCEDYGLYGEEDADYDFRIKCKGLLNVYMEDENIGFHLPGGKAAVIDPHTYTATDDQEEIEQADYRKWKDELRRNNVTNGKYYRNINEYSQGIRSLFVESKFADQYLKQKSRSTELNDQIERKEARIGKLKVSIIIPVFNQIELTKKCLNAIFQNTPPDLFEIIIIDNASTDETSIYLSNLRERIKFITNNQNMGFAKACNQGVNKASGKYLLFLNNDTEVQSEWLNSLVEVLDKDKSVAAVGSKLLFPDRTIQHAGVAIVNDQKLPDPLVARHIYYQQAENFPKANEISTYQALTAACLLVRRSAFEAVEGFDELYWNGYEDTDLCFKFQKQGWLLIYQPKSVVIHYESQSGPERFSRVQHNIERLHQKWLGKINPDLMIKPDGTGIETGAGCIRPYQMETSANQQLIDSTELIKQFTSIIILTCNQIEYTKKCIDSIFKHTQEAFELILVDNGSTDGTLEYLESEIAVRNGEVKVKIIKNKKNEGFAAGNNQGIAAAKGNYILLMNNDVVVTHGWLSRMVACAEKSPDIGMVGPVSNYVSGPQLLEGVDYDTHTLKGLIEFSKKFADHHAGQAQQILRVVGFCMLIKWAVIDKIGGMDDRYGLGNFEDDDFSLRATIAGFQSWIARDCFVHHFGHRTFIGEKVDLSKSLHKNWGIFKGKWGLPAEMPYGSPYRLSEMKNTRFDSSIHYYPLDIEGVAKKLSANDVKTAEAQYSTIQANLNTRSSEEIMEDLAGLVESYPEFALAHNDLGVLYYTTGNKEKALQFYEKAVQLDPENMIFQKNLADFYYVELGRVEDALQIYVKISEVHPDDVETLLITGHICVALEKFQDAEVFYSRVLEIEPGHPDARQFQNKLNLMQTDNSGAKTPEGLYLEAQPLLNNGDPHRAIAALEGLLEKFPDFALAHNEIGVLYYHTGDKEKARHHYERAVEIMPENINFQKNLADYYCLELGRIEEALNIYVGILTTHPRDIETLLATGQICVALERPGDAKAFYHRVLELEPGNENASNYLRALDKHPITSDLSPSESANTVSILTDKVYACDLEKNRSVVENRPATVSVIISLDGIQNGVKECIKSVMVHTPDPYEILLINRGASKGLLKWAQNLVKDNDLYQIIECNRKAGWAESLNEAVQKASGEMIVLMHNDVVVSENWLKAFEMCINLVPNIGVMGPMSNRTEGIQQIITCDESDRVGFESIAKAFYEQYQFRRVTTRKLSNFCLAFPRELPEKIGYFDEQFVSEEVVIDDFCNRVVSGGYQNLIAADTYVLHHDRHKALKGVSVKNQANTADRKKYNEKWNAAQNPQAKAALTVQLLARAEELSQQGQIDPAVEVLFGAIGFQPDDPRVYLSLSEMLLAAKRFQDVKDALTEMSPADESQEIRKTQLLAYAEEGLENFEAAQIQIEQVLLMNPGFAPALNLKGILAYRNDDPTSAEKFFKQAIDSDPGYGEPYTNLGMLSLETDRPQDALRFFEKAFRLTPTDLDIATNYHSYIDATADFIRAEVIAREAAALHPNNQKIRYMLVDFLVQQGKYEMAMPEIEDAIIKFGSDNGIIGAALKVREKLGPITIQKLSKKTPVSVCMIIKDEEKYLARCLASVKPIVDEIIVVDTGSTDRSKDIAIAFGARVYDYEWQKDFAEARNYSISKASGGWILILDGDEVISTLDHAHFNKIVQKTPRAPIAYSIITRNYNKLANIVGWMPNDGTYPDEEAGIGWLPSEKVRLFFGKDQIRFEGPVHELVDPVLKRNGIEIKKCHVPVHHYGRLDKEKLDRKDEMYFDIGLKKLSAKGDDLNALRELAIQATILEKNQEALELWQRLLALNPIPNLAAIAYVNMGTIYSRLEKFEDALDAGRKAVECDPELKEARYNHAMAELHCGNAAQTIQVLEDLLKGFPDYPPARFILSAAYCCGDQKEKGLERMRELKDTPMGAYLDIPCSDLAQSLIAAGKMKYAVSVLGVAIESGIVNPQLLALFKKCVNMEEVTQRGSYIPQPFQENFQETIIENLPQ